MYCQRQLGEGFIHDSVEDCWEPWMKAADEILDDEELIDLVYEALRRRRPQSATRGRKGTPAEVALRMLVLKHMRNWSFEIVEREVRANLVYRMLTRVGSREGSRCEDAWENRTRSRTRDHSEGTRPDRRNRGGKEDRKRSKDAGRYDGHGKQHSLSHRQQSVGRWCASADTNHEADRRNWGQSRRASSRSDEKRGPPHAGDRADQPSKSAKTESGKTAGRLQAFVECDGSSRGSGEADRRGSESGYQESEEQS